jgi:cell wall-associated NlpC family hydrolase
VADDRGRRLGWWVGLFAALLLLATAVPVLLGAATAPPAGPPRCDKEQGSALVHALSPRQRVRFWARHHLGIRYVWGGTTHAGLDCSGFVQHVYSHAGFCLPRTSRAQAYARGVTLESWSRARLGDLVYWRRGHIAIYRGWWSGRHHIWESGRPGTRTRGRALSPRTSSWDRLALPRRVDFTRLRRC